MAGMTPTEAAEAAQQAADAARMAAEKAQVLADHARLLAESAGAQSGSGLILLQFAILLLAMLAGGHAVLRPGSGWRSSISMYHVVPLAALTAGSVVMFAAAGSTLATVLAGFSIMAGAGSLAGLWLIQKKADAGEEDTLS